MISMALSYKQHAQTNVLYSMVFNMCVTTYFAWNIDTSLCACHRQPYKRFLI